MSEDNPAQILVVEDEPDIAALVAYQLTHAGYRVRTASTGREALMAIDAEPPDLVVLDLMLPEVGGTEVLRTIRGRKQTQATPVILLTARAEEKDRLQGFELGADDYIAKPFSPRELVARVRAVLRRARQVEDGASRGRVLRAGSLVVEVEAHRVTVDGNDVNLTPKEFGLLRCLMERRGRIQSRQDLLEVVWETTADIETRTVDMHVGRLRTKLGAAGEQIETVRSFGYRFRRED
ncbi:MAG TPA: response regulator transcription factor [Gemmatimonadota bacterium]|nr:response regulator transcription factor [Gemmatimonadota bacterium]